jgi:hypothetical protein
VTSPQTPPAPRRHTYLLVATLVVSALALVVGLAGVALSAVALSHSDDAVNLAEKANNRPAAAAPTTAATTEAAPAPAPTGTEATTPATEEPAGDTATPSDISPTADYTTAYEGEHLRVRSTGCGGNFMEVDLDEPRVAGENIYLGEFSFEGCEAPGKLSTNLAVAEVSGPTATPHDCLETIRTDPGRNPIAPTRGTTLCFVTDQKKAASEGETQKLVFVTVDSVSVDNRTVVLNVTMKAWNVPQ